MKMKYYLRGIGVGIIIATLILCISDGISGSGKKENKPEPTKGGTVLDNFPTKSEKESQSTEEAKTEKASESEKQTESRKPEESEKTTMNQSEKETVSEKPSEGVAQNQTETNAQKIVVNIPSYWNESGVFASELQDKGVISDAKDFNDYLVRNGYDQRISSGIFEFTKGMSYEDIIKIVIH